MSDQGSQASAEDRWARSQRAQGRADARRGHQAVHADQHYQQGYREASERAAGFHIDKESMWMGNGFGVETLHVAYVGGERVGEWTRRRIVGNYAYDKRGAAVLTFKQWRAALEAGRTRT